MSSEVKKSMKGDDSKHKKDKNESKSIVQEVIDLEASNDEKNTSPA